MILQGRMLDNAIADLVRGKGRVRKCGLGSAEARSDRDSLFCRDGMAIASVIALLASEAVRAAPGEA